MSVTGSPFVRSVTQAALLLLVSVCCLAVAVACASAGMDDAEEQPGIALPADGMCRSGVVVKKGERCTHAYSYRSGISITSEGAQPIVKNEAIEFRVDDDGFGHYGDRLSGTSLESTVDLGDEKKIVFIARGRDDGSFIVEEATQIHYDASQASDGGGPSCTEGLELKPGERCTLPGGGEFAVESGGDGCIEGSLCSGRGLNIQGFIAERQEDNSWRIVSTR